MLQRRFLSHSFLTLGRGWAVKEPGYYTSPHLTSIGNKR